MLRTLSLPSTSAFDSGNVSDSGSISGLDAPTGAPPRFPHTRAQLSAIARQHKPLETYDSDADGDEFGRVSSSFVNKVVGLLDEEHEDELKALLKETYAMDDETVSIQCYCIVCVIYRCLAHQLEQNVLGNYLFFRI